MGENIVQIERADRAEQARTSQQNRALHAYFRRVAEELCDRGEDMRELVKIPIQPTEHNVKVNLFQPYIESLFGKSHTSELTAAELTLAVDAFQRAMAMRLGVAAPFTPEEGGRG